eukprot:g324.t1
MDKACHLSGPYHQDGKCYHEASCQTGLCKPDTSTEYGAPQPCYASFTCTGTDRGGQIGRYVYTPFASESDANKKVCRPKAGTTNPCDVDERCSVAHNEFCPADKDTN